MPSTGLARGASSTLASTAGPYRFLLGFGDVLYQSHRREKHARTLRRMVAHHDQRGDPMTGIWAEDETGTWQAMTASGFANETELHNLLELTPSMLPLAGSPRIAVLGREVRCGRERADLVAVEVDTGRPVVVEVKLAANTDRRQALTQALGYAAYLRRVDAGGMAALVQQYLTSHEFGSIAEAAQAVAHDDPEFTVDAFNARLADALADGRLRAVIVLDAVPLDLVELVGYLQDVTNDRLTLDLVVVTSYDIAGRRVLVPQLVEPDRSQVTAEAAGTGTPAVSSEIVKGGAKFNESITHAPSDAQPELARLYSWARQLEADGLTVLHTSIGKGRWVLRLVVPGQDRCMVALWNENGAYLSPYRTVLQQLAPAALSALDARIPGEIGQGNNIKSNLDDALLGLLSRAYAEATSEHI